MTEHRQTDHGYDKEAENWIFWPRIIMKKKVLANSADNTRENRKTQRIWKKEDIVTEEPSSMDESCPCISERLDQSSL